MDQDLRNMAMAITELTAVRRNAKRLLSGKTAAFEADGDLGTLDKVWEKSTDLVKAIPVNPHLQSRELVAFTWIKAVITRLNAVCRRVGGEFMQFEFLCEERIPYGISLLFFNPQPATMLFSYEAFHFIDYGLDYYDDVMIGDSYPFSNLINNSISLLGTHCEAWVRILRSVIRAQLRRSGWPTTERRLFMEHLGTMGFTVEQSATSVTPCHVPSVHKYYARILKTLSISDVPLSSTEVEKLLQELGNAPSRSTIKNALAQMRKDGLVDAIGPRLLAAISDKGRNWLTKTGKTFNAN